MFELIENVPSNAVIKVIGVGGGGGNAVKHMIANNVEGVDFICANTDAQALSDIESKTVLQLGGDITKGLGALGPTRKSAGRRPWKIGSASPMLCRVPIWCLSPRAWVAEPVPAAHR